ncbi:MAG: efflux transporter periplasmic adaptor subunit [Candidatus Hydrogenedentota bacterium]|nr:MAG: efflux transporter periplasmic adaptor subunit [Candidatus Hydrogenedentota bacterium]PCJ60483.1 MAG: efflux transporter periplasmic adaptor subunit [Candidatus Hydrogenedentota bacterium]
MNIRKKFYMAALSFGILGTVLFISQATFSQDDHDHDHAEEKAATSHDEDHAHDESEESDKHGNDDGHGHNEEAEDDGHGHGDDEDHDESLRLSDKDLLELNISIEVAGPGLLEFHASFPGEVRLNEDKLAHVVPNIAGVVKEVTAHLGDIVKKGDVMAILASRELAETKAEHLASHAQLELLEVTYKREKQLWKDKISAEQDFLIARNALEKGRIDLRASEQRLYALGLSIETIHKLENESNTQLTRFEVRAPFTGTVIEKHITLGEAIDAESQIFSVADLSTVWVDLSVYSKDLLSIRKGQKVIIASETAIPDTEGIISYIGPIVGEETRTSLARIVLPTNQSLWRPGMFITAKVAVDEMTVPIKVPKTALLTIDGETRVFIRDAEGFKAVDITLGRVDMQGAEILSGLEAGQHYVATGGFYLKAELGKAAFADGGHNH